MSNDMDRVRVVLEGLALIQQQEWDGDEVYVLVTPIRAGVRGPTVRHPSAPQGYWKLKEQGQETDSRIGPGVRPLDYELAKGLFNEGDKLELAFWEEDFAPIDPDDPLTIVTLHFKKSPSGRTIARLFLSRKVPDSAGTDWIRPPAADPSGQAIGAARVVGKGGAEYGAYLRLEES